MPAPLDILYAGTLPPHPGGTAIACSQILLGLAEAGHSVRSIAPITAEALEAGDSFARSAPQLRVRRYIVPHFVVDSPVAPAAYWALEAERLEPALAGALADKRPDVVIAGRESFGLHVPRLAATAGVPSVVVAHDGRWLGAPPRQGSLPSALLAQLRTAGRVVAPARHLAEGLREAGIETVRTVPNPVDPARFRRRPRDRELARVLGIDDGDVVVAHASNLKPVKRALDLVHSAPGVLARDPRVVYVVVGDGPCRVELEAACTELGVADRFRFAGWVAHERMPAYVCLADVVVMPSESETQSLVCLEAQAGGRALLASDIPGAREIVADGETGLLFERGNVEDLTAKTLLLARRPELRRRLGAQARRRVSSHSPARVVASYEEILLEVANGGHASPVRRRRGTGSSARRS